MTALVVFCALLGLIVGSFLNVVIWRLPRGESIVRPRSQCPGCGTQIASRDNVPVLSWLLLHRRCRHCGERISGRYPAVELGTAALFALMALRIGFDPALPAFLYLMAVGLALALIDWDVKRLPNALTLPSYGVGLVLLGLACTAGGEGSRMLRVVLGMVALYVFYLVLRLVHPAGMGFGDVKLAGVLGLYLGYLGWGELAVGAFLGFLLGAVGGSALMLVGRAGRKSTIPFGPYMLAGTLLAILFGQPIVDAYVALAVG